MLVRLLQAAGLEQTDVNVVNMESTLHLSALRSGRVSVVVSYEPMAGLLRAAGYKDIFDSRQMPGDIVDVLVVRASALQARSAQVDALLAGWQRGLLALQEHPEAAARLLAPGVEISPEDYLATLQKLTFYSAEQSLELLSGVPPVLAQDALRLVTTLQAVGMIKVAPDWGRLLDPEPALRLQARKGGV
jgi:NitT/TauT family transport system substrate-binding protein